MKAKESAPARVAHETRSAPIPKGGGQSRHWAAGAPGKMETLIQDQRPTRPAGPGSEQWSYYGPFRNADKAEAVAARLNARHNA